MLLKWMTRACQFNGPFSCGNFLTILSLVCWKCSDVTTFNKNQIEMHWNIWRWWFVLTLAIRHSFQYFTNERGLVQTESKHNCWCPFLPPQLMSDAGWCDVHVQVIGVKNQRSVQGVNKQTFCGGCRPVASWWKDRHTTFAYTIQDSSNKALPWLENKKKRQDSLSEVD